MSKKIAPGRWDPILRMAAKSWTKVVGVALIAVGMAVGLMLTKIVLLDTDREIGMWSVVLVAVPSMVPFALGAMAVFPNVVTPIVYRFLAKKSGEQEEEGS